MSNEILSDLKGENNKAFGELYKNYFGMVSRFIINNNGRTDDAEDIFQDTLLVLLEKLRQDNFVLTASLKTYVMAIAKNLWLKKLRTPHTKLECLELGDNDLLEDINQSIEEERTYWEKLQSYLTKITNHCKGLIHAMFFHEKTIEQIQQEYGYSTKHNAQNQKHKCMEQIRKAKEQDKDNA
ncbi:RNA polymerase subunit sigma-70 [Elizabethkingia anophelis]|uniref:Sigma-70 family RNA polymerase sigma factor n=2 Tax=Elizabethkingia TaxID=308865 RepID=A0ABD5B842_ELIMR|nr:sigma-70 family RNA polymerase sigma factor [Elizabethkingia miricola]MBS1740474.1 sigma-70 family RNA polymerase sigma factor [Bacteroidota bacterium]MDQ8750054.1 sigma-70 family RNA polymerase sigma factor [Elizabethkingia miricola]MDV3616155.1 RNA polymerase subunit sigma-70 [Elizabethkingia anophelis]MDV3664400.1 RNA polymerase subunit sigma-70 [Elizabethkingia anophelis]